MTLQLLYFAWLRERVGLAEEAVPLPDGVSDVATLLDWQRRRSPAHAAAFADTRVVRCAVNQEFAGPDIAVHDGDEVAFFPPVTGG
jgi:molybdopterin converting factor subunit 1